MLRAVGGVTSAHAYPAGRVDSTQNNNCIKVVIVDLDKPLKVHCSKLLPTKLHAAREAKRQLAEMLGSEAIEKAAGDMTLAQEFLLDGTLHTAPTPPGGRILGLDPAPPQPPATTALASALQGDLQRVREKPSTRQAGSRPSPQPARQPVAPAQPLVAQQPSQQPAGLVILDPD